MLVYKKDYFLRKYMLELEDYISKYRCNSVVEKACFDISEEFDNIKALYYTVGKNKVFAFFGVPKTEMPVDGYPAVVLVHGGDGCAYFEWVKKWTDKGFVAIAPDFNGNCAVDLSNRRVNNPLGGPKGYGSFTQMEREHPWTFFSVLSIINAVDVLTLQTSVNKEQISICGLSWGGVLSLIALSVEKRFKVASIIYSSGNILDTEFFINSFNSAGLNEKDKELYLKVFDPQAYVEKVGIPVLFIAGADDVAFTMQSRKKTTNKMDCEKHFSYRQKLPHGHSAGWSCREAIDFVACKLQNLTYPTLKVDIKENKIIVDYPNGCSNVQLVYTKDCFNTTLGQWNSVELLGKCTMIPTDCKYFFISVLSKDGSIYSSDVFCV